MRGERASLKTSDAPRGLALPEIAQEGFEGGVLVGPQGRGYPDRRRDGVDDGIRLNITKHG